MTLVLMLVVSAAGGCRYVGDGVSVEPRTMRDVPAQRLAFRFEPDVNAESLPPSVKDEEAADPLPAIKADFETRRPDDALIRTVVSPDGQRALALYGTGQTESTDFRMDLYSSDGLFIRNVLPPDLIGAFPSEVAWAPDGQRMAFIAVRNPESNPAEVAPSPADPAAMPPAGEQEAPAAPSPTIGPIIPSAPSFLTEQMYVGDRDGFNLRPLTTREGLIYFQFEWSPDGQWLAALAAKEDEWFARRDNGLAPAGRPRIVSIAGQERLLDDRLTDVKPSWSPDASKVVTAFDYTVAIYDAAGAQPTGAALPLSDPLRAASVEYDARIFRKNAAASATPNDPKPPTSAEGGQPPSGEQVLNSLNPFVRVEWTDPRTIYLQTAFVRIYRGQPPITSYPRWHVLHLSPQATVLSRTLRDRVRRPSRDARSTRSI